MARICFLQRVVSCGLQLVTYREAKKPHEQKYFALGKSKADAEALTIAEWKTNTYTLCLEHLCQQIWLNISATDDGAYLFINWLLVCRRDLLAMIESCGKRDGPARFGYDFGL